MFGQQISLYEWSTFQQRKLRFNSTEINGMGWVFFMTLNNFQFLFHPVLVPGVQAAVESRIRESVWITQEEMILLHCQNLSLRPSLKKRGGFSLQLQCPTLEPTQVLESSKVQYRVADPEETVLGRSSTPPSQKYRVSAWRNRVSWNILHVAALSLTWHFFACVTKNRGGGYALKQARS